MQRTGREAKSDWVRAGIIAGIIGGAALALFWIIPPLSGAEAQAQGLRAASYPFIGSQVLEGGLSVGAMALGTLVHFIFSIALGLVFAFSVRGLSRTAIALLGVVFGLGVWLVMFYVVLPAVGAADAVRGIPVPFAALQHVVFGIGLGAVVAGLQPQRWRQPQERAHI